MTVVNDIIDAPSPNYDDRREALSMLVLHYTGMETGEGALARLRDPVAKVSSHYLVEEDGRIFQLVADDKRAWHAGRGQWRGLGDINSRSIGVEIVNGGHDFGLPHFTEPQIKAVIALSRDIVQRHDISPEMIVGHSDIAPDRKEDPGERFPWSQLAQVGLGHWPAEGWSTNADPGTTGLINALSRIGYEFGDDVKVGLPEVVTAFQRRWCPAAVTGVANLETRQLARAVSRLYVADR